LTILAAAAAATIVLSAVSFLAAPPNDAPPVDGSSFASHPGGARATYLALKEAGYDVQRSYEPLVSALRRPAQTVLVLVEPVVKPSQLDRRALRAFVESGGIVLAAGRLARPFLPGTVSDAAGEPADATVVRAAVPSRLSRGVPEIVMTPAATGLSNESPYTVIFGTYARPAVLAARFGTGEAIHWTGSGPLSNGGVTAPGHARLLVNALGDPSSRTVLWDEHYHGLTRSLWSYIAQTPMPFAGAQLAFVFVCALLTFARRRSPVRPLPVVPRTSPLEFVESIGALYQRANAAPAAVATVRARTRRLLLAACRLPSTVPDDQLGRAAGERLGVAPAELQHQLETSARARNAALAPGAARAVIADLQRITARLRAPAARRGASNTANKEKTG
jgi:hypothetical protein